jgi:hypothetical protein
MAVVKDIKMGVLSLGAGEGKEWAFLSSPDDPWLGIMNYAS